jgi:hypothetical protein
LPPEGLGLEGLGDFTQLPLEGSGEAQRALAAGAEITAQEEQQAEDEASAEFGESIRNLSKESVAKAEKKVKDSDRLSEELGRLEGLRNIAEGLGKIGDGFRRASRIRAGLPEPNAEFRAEGIRNKIKDLTERRAAALVREKDPRMDPESTISKSARKAAFGREDGNETATQINQTFGQLAAPTQATREALDKIREELAEDQKFLANERRPFVKPLQDNSTAKTSLESALKQLDIGGIAQMNLVASIIRHAGDRGNIAVSEREMLSRRPGMRRYWDTAEEFFTGNKSVAWQQQAREILTLLIAAKTREKQRLASQFSNSILKLRGEELGTERELQELILEKDDFGTIIIMPDSRVITMRGPEEEIKEFLKKNPGAETF